MPDDNEAILAVQTQLADLQEKYTRLSEWADAIAKIDVPEELQAGDDEGEGGGEAAAADLANVVNELAARAGQAESAARDFDTLEYELLYDDLPDGTAQYQVLTWTGTEWIADWTRLA